MRLEEFRQSVKIIRQAIEGLPEGPIVGKVPRLIKPPAGETYHAIESPKGEIGYFIVSDGKSTNPYRFRVRPPSFCNLQALPQLIKGHMVADVVALIGSHRRRAGRSRSMIDTYLIPLVKILFVLNATLIGVTYMVLLERKVIAWVQVRLGPMRVGPYGSLQPIADAIKLILKEDITPTRADKWVFTAAPIIVMVPALITFAVIPFGPSVHLFGRDIPLYITDVNVGLLYIVSVASIGVYGIILGGWASNSKFPLLASLRASAQLISYEVAVTMTLVSLIMTAGTLSMVKIVEAQYNAHLWFIFVQPVAFVLFFIGGLAETNRAPFDMAEAEQELTGGFHTEYSGMRFALFFLAEYANMIVVSAVATTLFLGGWLRAVSERRMRCRSWTSFPAGSGSC